MFQPEKKKKKKKKKQSQMVRCECYKLNSSRIKDYQLIVGTWKGPKKKKKKWEAASISWPGFHCFVLKHLHRNYVT
jgi:hypothetical protein